MEILSDATEKICGYKADPGMVEEFIRNHFEQWSLARDRASAAPVPPPPRATPTFPVLSDNSSGIKTKKPEFFADKSITSFSFKGNSYPVKSWEDMLTTLCNCVATAHPQDFEKVLWLYDDLKPCFSRMFRPFRDAGHYVYLHTDGHILEIIPDLIETGVRIINPQIRANGQIIAGSQNWKVSRKQLNRAAR